ncbi:GerAB/ArcD/ProY family transporter [Neobacillus drentensis]|uniref:GerAB/ArcD/ProY family transporter n=1 Tax=Neobacillus drentensis TaxID=220684 RepID=UPI002FFFC89A
MEQPVPEKAKVSPFLAFFIIHQMQFGVGVLGFQRIIAQSAGYDGWIAVLIGGLSVHAIVWIMYKIVEMANGDIITANTLVFGRKIGKLLSLPFVVYFILIMIATLRAFIEVIQVWVFQDMSTFWYALALCTLAIYIVFGGFRTVTGVAFFGTILPFYLIFTFLFTLPYADFKNLLPIFDHSIIELVKASYQMSITYLGYEVLLFVYPYIKEPQKSKKWVHYGVSFSTLLYLYLSIVTFAYFSEGQLKRYIWPTLTMWKIVELPFVERFDLIGIANWNLVILPSVCISLWCASRTLKRVTNLKQKYGVLLITMVVLIAINFFKTRQQIHILLDFTGKISFFINYGYIPLLFLLLLIVKKLKKG